MICNFLFVLVTVVQGIQGNELGRPFNILHGLKPVLPVAKDFSPVFYPVKKTKLFNNIQHETIQSDYPYFSDFVQLTYHPDDKDLIKAFFSIWQFKDENRDAAPFTFQPTSDDTQDTQHSYAKLLGISPENMVDKSYVLARYWKKLNTTTLTTADFSDLTLSSFSSDSTSDHVTELFAKYGTHYLSGYEMGDMIYQVFVYDKDKAEDVLRFPFHDPNYNFGFRGNTFRQFTQPVNRGSTGFCQQAGKILSASGDTALENITPKLRDDVYMVSESIFMFPVKPNAFEMMENLTKIIPLRLFFKPIVDKLLQSESPSRSKWKDVLSASVFQKFGSASSPNFPALSHSGLQELYASFNPDLVTSSATSYVTLNRMTFRLDDFAVLNPEHVTHLFIFADVLEIDKTAKLKLPGSQKIYLVCREFVAFSSGSNVPEIIVGAQGKSDPALKIIAKEFRGILKVTYVQQGTHYTYANGLVYKTSKDPNMEDQYMVKTDNTKQLLYPDKQCVPEFYDTDGNSHEEKWLQRSLVNSFELAVTSIETILNVQTSKKSANKARESLVWIEETLSRSSNKSSPLSADLEMLLGRVLLISKTSLIEYAKTRLIVPRLSFPQYKPLYEKLLSAVATYEATFVEVSKEIKRRKQVETTTNSLKELNQNVKSIGSFLVEQAEVNSRYQEDIANTQQAIHKLEKDRILREQGQADSLLQEIMSIQGDVSTAGDVLVKALKQYEKEQIASAVLNVAQVVGSLFTGGVGLGNIDSNLQGIIRVAEKLKNVVTIIEQVNKLYDLGINMRNDIGTINRALENIPSGEIHVETFPTDLEWEDFDTDVRSYASTESFLPDQVAGEALDFQRVAKRLSVRGRKYVNIAAKIADIKYKQIKIEMQRDLAKRQSNRLRILKKRLTQDELTDNDAKTTDLFELGNIIKMKENQVRVRLVQTFVVMDAALQYHYLQNATLLESFDTMAIQEAALNQIQSSILALESFPSLPKDLHKPIEYNISNVPVQDLLSKDGYKVSIPLSSLPFHEYVRVRILRMEVRADNISKSADNTAYIQATTSGESFQDRDLSRSPRTYSTIPTEYRTVYNIKTGETIGNPSEEYADKFIKITPFDDWTFRIPKVTTNKGVLFNTVLTTLRIKFYLRAIFNPSPLIANDQKLLDDVSGSKDNLLTILNGRSLVREWDAIMAVNAKRVNEIWKKQYDDQTKNGFVKRILTNRTVSFDSRRLKIETRVILEVGPPMIQFIPNNQNRATLRIQIKSGTVEYWEKNKRSGEVDNYQEHISVSDGSTISGSMNLLKIRGSVSEDSTVVLDLSNGVFDVLNLGLSEHVEMSTRNEIQIFFNTKLKSKDFELTKITYEKQLTPASLVPVKFYLATGGFGNDDSKVYGSLFIFLTTHATGVTANEQTKRDFNDPLTIDQQIIPTDYDVALFINNRVIFKNIIMADIEKHFNFGAHTKVLPGMSTSPSQQSVYVVGDSNAKHLESIHLDFERTPLSADFIFEIPGNTLRAKSINRGRKIQVHWVNNNMEKSVPYAYFPWVCRTLCSGRIQYETVTFSTSYVKTFAPTIDEDQTISYTEEGSGSASSSVSWSTDVFGTSNFKHARETVTSRVDNYMKDLRFNFRSISTFAITQVVFPDKNTFHLTEVYIPGDMLILGKVKANESVPPSRRQLHGVIHSKKVRRDDRKSER